jgi:dephospho-CoA kinase
LVGLVGGIASGKSLASRWFAEHGWSVVDADRVAHGLYAPGTALNERLVEVCGAQVRSADGSIDRKTLGAMVFSDAQKLRQLDALVHPALREELQGDLAARRERGERVVLEMALLHRWPDMVERLDLVVGISAAREVRLERLMARNGLPREEAELRLARQEPEAVLLSCATVVVPNEGGPEGVARALERLFAGA